MKISKLLILGMLVCVLCTTQTLGQAPSVACGVAGYDHGTSSLALVAHEGEVLDYVVDVTNGPFPIENGVVTLTLPDGTVVTLDITLSLAALGTAQYPVTFPPVPANQEYTINSGHIGNNSAPANSVQALSSCVADAIIGPDTSVEVTGTGQWPTLVINPAISIEKSAAPDGICEGLDTEVTYTYTVTWGAGGDTDLENVVLDDDTCESISGPTGDDGDGVLEDGETWTYTCTTTLSTTTTNTVTVTAEDETGYEVQDEAEATVTAYDAPECSITGPDQVCEDEATDLVYTSENTAERYKWSVTGDATIDGLDNAQTVTIDATGDFTLSLVLCNGPVEDECCDDCFIEVDVVPTPDCTIDGPESVCEDATGIEYCSNDTADSYHWDITGDGSIVSPDNEQCVTVDAGTEGSFTLTLKVCNESGEPGTEDDCCDECSIDVDVEPCGVFCGFTQGFWGNAGGMACDPSVTTTDLLIALLDAADASTPGSDPVVVGQLGVRSITFDTANCILLRLPAGGKPKALPAKYNADDFGDRDCGDLPNKLLKKGRLNNVLIGQVVALTLNVRLNSIPCSAEGSPLGGFTLPDEFCTVGEDGCAEKFSIPESLQGITVEALLGMANDALAGLNTPASIGAINDAVTAVNEAFDECAEVVDCPTEEICDNNCDDDFDGYTDCEDTDCPPCDG